MTKSQRVARQRVLAVVLWALTALAACSDEAQVIGEPEATTGSVDPEPEDSESEEGSALAAPPVGDPATDNAAPNPPPPNDPIGEPLHKPPDEPSGGMQAAPAAFTTPRGACDLATRVGRFSIESQVDFGVVQGTVDDGVVPTAIPTLVLEQAGCRVLQRRNLSCVPGCVGAETCGEAGTCIPYPRQVSVGEVTITGLTKATGMSPQLPGSSYFSPGADNPPYAAQSQIILSASGGAGGSPFQLFGVGSEPLTEGPSWVLEAGSDLALTWPAPTADAGTTVLIELTIDQHGISPLSLSCEVDDTGSATVPAGIIDQLIGSGVSGFPNGRITRRTADKLELGAGCVELVVGSPRAASVSVAGFTPCNGPEDCGGGEACNLALERCE